MSAAKFMPGRCNYCHAPSVVSFSYRFHFSKMGQRRGGSITVRACAKHEGCVNWNSNRALHADAPLVRAP